MCRIRKYIFSNIKNNYYVSWKEENFRTNVSSNIINNGRTLIEKIMNIN